MTWEIFGEASRALAQMVADDYEPDMILSIARGGLLIGGALGYALSVKNVYTMNVEFYTGVDERLEVPRILPPAPDFVDVSHAREHLLDDEPLPLFPIRFAGGVEQHDGDHVSLARLQQRDHFHAFVERAEQPVGAAKEGNHPAHVAIHSAI